MVQYNMIKVLTVLIISVLHISLTQAWMDHGLTKMLIRLLVLGVHNPVSVKVPKYSSCLNG